MGEDLDEGCFGEVVESMVSQLASGNSVSTHFSSTVTRLLQNKAETYKRGPYHCFGPMKLKWARPNVKNVIQINFGKWFFSPYMKKYEKNISN